MRLEFLPTLTDIRGMLGEELYVKFVWMWREQEQETRSIERRARYAAVTPKHQVESWPTPVFSRVEDRPVPTPAQAFQAAIARAPRPGDTIEVGDLAGFLDRVGATTREEPREVATAGRRRRR
jgi:hypothetical protein